MAKLFNLKNEKNLSITFNVARSGGVPPQPVTFNIPLSGVYFAGFTPRVGYAYSNTTMYLWFFTKGNVIPFAMSAPVPTGGTYVIYSSSYRLSGISNALNNSSVFGAVPILTNDEVSRANATISAMDADSDTYFTVIEILLQGVAQSDFKIVADFPVILPNAEKNSELTDFYNGDYWNLIELSGYYDNSEYLERCKNMPAWTITYKYVISLLTLPFVLANGNTNYDYNVPSPFEPMPETFYLTVNVVSDEATNGEQSITYTWTPTNAEDTDLSLITLHFRYERGNRSYTEDVPYTDGSYSVTYRDVVNKMGFEWWRNIISRIPLVGEQIAESTIDNYVYWSDNVGNSGSCVLEIKYNGSNEVAVAEAQQASTGYWCYLAYGEGSESQDYNDPNNPYSDLSSFGGGADALNGSALLTTSYAISASTAHTFGSWLWGTGLDLEQLKLVVNNPIENIVSCKLFPFSVTGGSEELIKLGNVESSVSGNKLPETVNRYFNFGDLPVTGFYGNFLDYAPYTKVTIYLPYIGFKELDPNEVMGRVLQPRYYVDLVTGVCRCVLLTFNPNISQTASIAKPIASYDGVIGQDVPVVGSNRAQIEAGYVVGGAKAVTEIASGIGSAITGNVGGTLNNIGNAVSTGINSAMAMYHTYTEGTPSPAVSRFDEQKCYVIINSPMYTEPTLYAHQNGKPCNLTCRLSELHGYTVIDNTVDLSTISCDANERDELLNILTSGIYL